MKIILTILTLFQFFFVLGQIFNITTKNIDLEVKKIIKPATEIELTQIVKHKGIFYCYFKAVNKSNSKRSTKFFLIFSEKGNDLRKIEIPKNIQNADYFKLFLRNDSIFTKTSGWDRKTFYLDRSTQKWDEMSEIDNHIVDNIIYEDDRFSFTHQKMGDFGNGIRFKDKQSKREFGFITTTWEYPFMPEDIINRIDSIYYITSDTQIMKIDILTELNKSKSDCYYKVINKEGEEVEVTDLFTHPDYDYNWVDKRPEIVFADTTLLYHWDCVDNLPKILFATSFVRENKLYHICFDSTRTFIAELENGQMKPIQNIDRKISCIDWFDLRCGKTLYDETQLLKFKINDKFGIMEINQQSINFYQVSTKK
jgi:hypothetical protein